MCLEWDTKIIGKCRDITDEELREVFDDTLRRCLFPDTIDNDLIERLDKCLSTRSTATRTRKVIQELIDKL